MKSGARQPRLERWALFLATLVAVGGLLYSVYGERQQTTLRVGEPSPETYLTPTDLDIIDRIETERERQSARAQIETVYTGDEELRELVINLLTSSGLPGESLDFLVTTYRDPDGVTAEELPAVIEEAVARAPADRQREVRLTLERRLVATATPNERLTQAARDAAANAIQPVMERLRAGQVIVRQGELLTEEQLRALEAAGLYSAQSAAFAQTLWILVGCLLLAALLALPVFYLTPLRLGGFSFQQVAFLVGLTLLTLAVQRLAVMASPSFVFVLLVPVLVTVLVSEVAGLLWAVWLALATALLVPASPLFTLAATLVGAVVATRLALTVRSRVSLLLAGAVGGLAGGLTLTVLTLVGGSLAPLPTLSSALFFTAGGVLAGIIGLGMLPLAESVFGFLTDFRLLELSSPTSPLLQKLLLEAPGSYQHSLIISNLVEQAVKNIGGNALLARVGALYHDTGKLRRPHFFVENQFSGENPHNTLSPHLSYLIITSHVRDGVELLREFGLPRALEPFVTEHHGTTVLSYFYKRALEDSATLDDLNFRYSGPRPRSKETAVLMLADAVESASRTLAEPTQGSIRAMIDRLIEQRMQDDQLSESPLNFHDLEVIANTFERMLTAILHRRISYPSAEEIKGLKRGGDPRRNPPVRA